MKYKTKVPKPALLTPIGNNPMENRSQNCKTCRLIELQITKTYFKTCDLLGWCQPAKMGCGRAFWLAFLFLLPGFTFDYTK